MLGLGAAAVVAPKVTYSFLGGILRPRPHYMTATEIMRRREEWLYRASNPPIIAAYDWIDMNALTERIAEYLNIPNPILADLKRLPRIT